MGSFSSSFHESFLNGLRTAFIISLPELFQENWGEKLTCAEPICQPVPFKIMGTVKYNVAAVLAA